MKYAYSLLFAKTMPFKLRGLLRDNVFQINEQYCCVTMIVILMTVPVPVVERSKARVFGRSLAGIVGSNPAEGIGGCPLCVVR